VRALLLITIAESLFGQSLDTRNLAQYRTHKPIRMSMFDKDRSHKEAMARAFLWENWQQRHRAQLIQTDVSKEGERSVTEFFIEPDSHGAWKINVNIDRERFSRDPHSPKRSTEKASLTCTALERVEPPPDLLHLLVMIPAEAHRLPETYRLNPRCLPERSLPTIW